MDHAAAEAIDGSFSRASGSDFLAHSLSIFFNLDHASFGLAIGFLA
jgi:hypothetical protein|tara:strand:+ start:431 stop:568 length:138 start_codon:yes stop_codon:yes gene_type:complete